MDNLLKNAGQAVQQVAQPIEQAVGGAQNTVGNFFGGIGNAVAQIPQELHQFLSPPPQPQQQIPIQQPQQAAQMQPLPIGQPTQQTGNPAIDSALSKRDPEVDKINPQDVLSQYADYLNKAVGQLKNTIGQGVNNVGNFLKPIVNSPIGKSITQPIIDTAAALGGVPDPITQITDPQLANRVRQSAAQQRPDLFTNSPIGPTPNLKAGTQAITQYGLLKNPISAAVMGGLNVPFTAVSDLLQGKNPLNMDVQKTVAQGVDFGGLLGPLSDATGVLLKPLISKINPVEIGNINQYINMAKNATTPEMRNQFIQLTAKRIFQNLNAAGIQGAVGFGAYGGLQPAKDLEQRIGNVLGNALQGYAFGAGGKAVGLGFQGAKEQLPALNTKLGEKGGIDLGSNPPSNPPPEAPVANAGLYDTGKVGMGGTKEHIAQTIAKEEQQASNFVSKVAPQLKDTGVKMTDNSIGVLKGNVRGHWIDNEDVYTFYPTKVIPEDMRVELQRVLPSDIKVSNGGIDIPKSRVAQQSPTTAAEALPTVGDMLKPSEVPQPEALPQKTQELMQQAKTEAPQEHPNLTQSGQTLLERFDNTQSLPDSKTLRRVVDENGIPVPEGRLLNQDKLSLLERLRQKGATYEVNPQGVKSAFREPIIRSNVEQEKMTPEQFEQDMEANSGKPMAENNKTIEQKAEDLPLREVLNRNPVNTEGTPLSNAPPGGLRDEYAKVYKELTSETPADYGAAGRDAAKTAENKMKKGAVWQTRIEAQVEKDLPDAGDRKLLRDYLDGALQKNQLPKNVQDVALQVRPLTDVSLRLKQQQNPNMGVVEHYFMRKPLGRENVTTTASRSIMKFTDENGKDIIGTPEYLGLQPTDLKGVYADAEGHEFTVGRANITDIEESGIQQYEKDSAKILGEMIGSVVKSKEKYGFISALKDGDVYKNDVIPKGMSAPKDFREVPIPQLEGYKLSPKMANSLMHFEKQYGSSNIAVKIYDGVGSVLRKSIFYNAIFHPANEYIQALLASGKKEGPLGMINLHLNLVGAIKSVMNKDDYYVEHLNQGGSLGGMFNTDKPGMFQRLGEKLTSNPDIIKALGGIDTLNPVRQLYRTNSKIVSMSDEVLRTGLYKTLENAGMATKDAIKTTDDWMVDYGNQGKFEKNVVNRFLIFYPWMKGLAKAGTSLVMHPAQNAGIIANFALLYATFSAAQYELQQVTGNKDARLRFPGLLGFARDLAEAPGQVANEHRLPNIVSGHINLMPKEAIQQLANRDLFTNKQIYNPLALPYNGVNPPTEAQARLGHLSSLLAPLQTLGKAFPVSDNPDVVAKKSVQELLLNQVGVSTPHLQGYQAVPSNPNSPLNTPNAQPGTGLDMLKKIQGVTQNTDAQTLSAYQVLAQIRQLDPNDPKRGAAEYNLYSTFPKLFQYAQDKAYANANDDESKVDPIYLKSNAAVAQKYMTYEKLNDIAPGSAEEKQYLKNNPEVLQLIQSRSAFYTANPIPQQPGSMAYMMPPQPSAAVQQQMDAKNYTDPATQAYLKAHLDYVNGQRAKQGLSPLDSYGNIQGSKNFGVVFGSSGSTGMPASVKRMIGREASYNRSQGKLKAKRMIASLGGKKKALSLGGGHVSLSLRPIKGASIPKAKQTIATISQAHKVIKQSKPIATNYKKVKKQKVRLA